VRISFDVKQYLVMANLRPAHARIAIPQDTTNEIELNELPKRCLSEQILRVVSVYDSVSRLMVHVVIYSPNRKKTPAGISSSTRQTGLAA